MLTSSSPAQRTGDAPVGIMMPNTGKARPNAIANVLVKVGVSGPSTGAMGGARKAALMAAAGPLLGILKNVVVANAR